MYVCIYIYIWLSAKIERYETAAWVYAFHTRFIPPVEITDSYPVSYPRLD